MKKRYYYCYGWLLPLLLCLLTACGDDNDYHYPSVKLEFLTAFSGADGSLQSVLTDEGETLPVLEDKTGTRIKADTLVRIISNYAREATADGAFGARLYALGNVFSVLPKAADRFEEGIKQDPVEVSSIWMGRDYLNMLLDIREDGEHKLHFVEEQVVSDAAGHCDVSLTLYHEAAEKVASYSRRAYASVPLRQYAAEGVKKVSLHFSVYTYAGEVRTYDFEYAF